MIDYEQIYNSVMEEFRKRCEELSFSDTERMFNCLITNKNGFSYLSDRRYPTASKRQLVESYMKYTGFSDNRYADEFADFLFASCRTSITDDIKMKAVIRHPQN